MQAEGASSYKQRPIQLQACMHGSYKHTRYSDGILSMEVGGPDICAGGIPRWGEHCLPHEAVSPQSALAAYRGRRHRDPGTGGGMGWDAEGGRGGGGRRQ